MTPSPSQHNKGTCPMQCCCSDYSHPQGSFKANNSDVCYADGTVLDRTKNKHLRDLGEKVWGRLRPPLHFGQTPPMVSARKVDIIRAQLMEKTKVSNIGREAPKSIGYYADVRTNGRSSMSVVCGSRKR